MTINDLMFPNDESMMAFMEMTNKIHTAKRPNDSYHKKKMAMIDERIMEMKGDSITEEDEYYPGYLNILGSLYLEKRNFQEAKKYFLKAIEIAPTYKAFWNNLSIAYYALGEKRKALDCFKEAILLENEHGSIITEGPDFFLQGKSLDEFLKDIDQFTFDTIQDMSYIALGKLTSYYSSMKEPTSELKCLIRLARFEPENPKIYLNIAKCFFLADEKKRAENFLKKASEFNPHDLQVLDFLVMICLARKDFQSAKKYLETIFEITPEDTRIMLYLARVHASLNEKEKIFFYLKKCLETDISCLSDISMDNIFHPYLDDLRETIMSSS